VGLTTGVIFEDYKNESALPLYAMMQNNLTNIQREQSNANSSVKQ